MVKSTGYKKYPVLFYTNKKKTAARERLPVVVMRC